MSKTDSYEDLARLQLALVQFQIGAAATGCRTVVVLEGRDAAGKDGSIKRITEFLSPRATRVVSLPKPSDRERSQWYFQRYVGHLPGAGELVIFNRSWYNRGGVEPVMGFCTPEEHADFLKQAPAFERMLTDSGITLIKLWLDISKKEQAERLEERRSDPMKALKVSALDAEAQARWDAYSAARDEMLAATHSKHAPWTCVATDSKKVARLNVIRRILEMTAPRAAEAPDKAVAFTWSPKAAGRLAP